MTPDSYVLGEIRIGLQDLDWAIAGTSESWPVRDGPPGTTHGRWNHWIDSRITDTDGVADEGVNYPTDDGKTLEKGRMLNPDTGKETDYEELWRDVDPKPPNNNFAVVEFDKGMECRGSVVLVGTYCQGLLRKGGMVTAERWERDAGEDDSGGKGPQGRHVDGWRRSVVIGEEGDGLPCAHIVANVGSLKVGEIIKVGDDNWVVAEVGAM